MTPRPRALLILAPVLTTAILLTGCSSEPEPSGQNAAPAANSSGNASETPLFPPASDAAATPTLDEDGIARTIETIAGYPAIRVPVDAKGVEAPVDVALVFEITNFDYNTIENAVGGGWSGSSDDPDSILSFIWMDDPRDDIVSLTDGQVGTKPGTATLTYNTSAFDANDTTLLDKDYTYTVTITDAPTPPVIDTPESPAGIDNPENRPLVVVPADQTEVTVPVGTMILFDVTRNSGWSSGGATGAIESEGMFIGDTLDENPYWGMYRAVEPGTDTITITLMDSDMKTTDTYEYTVTVE